LVNKVFLICSFKASLIGLHKEVMSLSTLRTQTSTQMTGQIFFSSVPNGVFNLVTGFTNLKEFGRLHCVIDSNKPGKSHWERNLRQYAHRAEPLFDVFAAVEALRWVLFVRNIDARGWELLLSDPKSSGNQSKDLSHGDSFVQACQAGEFEIVKAMVERTQVDMEARDRDRMTPLHWAARYGHLSVVQYLCEQGADNEARNMYHNIPLHWAARYGHLPAVQYLCEQGADMEVRNRDCMTPLHWAARYGHLPVMQCLCEQGLARRRGMGMIGQHCTGHHARITSLWCSTSKG